MMKMLLISWRSLWKQGDFPFYFVQLPKIGNRNLWPEFREEQQNCLSNPNTGMIVTLDQGHVTDVHPAEKEIVGKRLADLALSKTYDQNVKAESPMFYNYDWQNIEHKIVLHFKNTYDGLKINNGYGPEGFYLQGYLRQGTVETIIAPEKIVVAKNEIIITYPTDFLPVKVKYAWAPFPENNLTNSSGLPLAPFKLELEGLN
jgi:sialate O-acetylesterase